MREVFVDSSVLIEGLKGNPDAVGIIYRLADENSVAIINDIVVSEFLFHYIRLKSGASPFTSSNPGKFRSLFSRMSRWTFWISSTSYLRMRRRLGSPTS